jgi:hypothetical protein
VALLALAAARDSPSSRVQTLQFDMPPRSVADNFADLANLVGTKRPRCHRTVVPLATLGLYDYRRPVSTHPLVLPMGTLFASSVCVLCIINIIVVPIIGHCDSQPRFNG